MTRKIRLTSLSLTKPLPHLYWSNEDAIGRFIEMGAFGAGHCEIVGVVADIRQTSLSDEPAPGIYIPFTQESMPWQTQVVRTKNDPIGLTALIRHERLPPCLLIENASDRLPRLTEGFFARGISDQG